MCSQSCQCCILSCQHEQQGWTLKDRTTKTEEEISGTNDNARKRERECVREGGGE